MLYYRRKVWGLIRFMISSWSQTFAWSCASKHVRVQIRGGMKINIEMQIVLGWTGCGEDLGQPSRLSTSSLCANAPRCHLIKDRGSGLSRTAAEEEEEGAGGRPISAPAPAPAARYGPCQTTYFPDTRSSSYFLFFIGELLARRDAAIVQLQLLTLVAIQELIFIADVRGHRSLDK